MHKKISVAISLLILFLFHPTLSAYDEPQTITEATQATETPTQATETSPIVTLQQFLTVPSEDVSPIYRLVSTLANQILQDYALSIEIKKIIENFPDSEAKTILGQRIDTLLLGIYADIQKLEAFIKLDLINLYNTYLQVEEIPNPHEPTLDILRNDLLGIKNSLIQHKNELIFILSLSQLELNNVSSE